MKTISVNLEWKGIVVLSAQIRYLSQAWPSSLVSLHEEI